MNPQHIHLSENQSPKSSRNQMRAILADDFLPKKKSKKNSEIPPPGSDDYSFNNIANLRKQNPPLSTEVRLGKEEEQMNGKIKKVWPADCQALWKDSGITKNPLRYKTNSKPSQSCP